MKEVITKLLSEEYGISAIKLTKLEGYESVNYRVKTRTDKYVLKVYKDNPTTKARIRGENQILKQLAHQKIFPLPINNKTGDDIVVVQKDQKIYRLLTYLEGTLWGDLTSTTHLISSLGGVLAKMDKVLLTIRNPEIESTRTNWDLDYFLDNQVYLNCIKDPSDRKLVHYFIIQWQTFIDEKVRLLRRSIIHNDCNDWNVLVTDNSVSGIIDFGDSVYSRLIYEVAICGTYIAMNQEDPVEVIATLIKSYHEILPLQEDEIEVFYYLIAGRLCTSLLKSSKAKKEATDTEYITISEQGARELLHRWITISPSYATNKWKKAIGISIKTEPSDLLSKRKIHTPEVLSTSYEEPIHMVSAAFQYMYDGQGNALLDAYNNIKHVGHCHPHVVQAGQRTMATLNTNTRYLYDGLTSYSEKLLSYFPDNLNKVFFVNSGSAASDLAVRLSQTYTRRKKMIVLEHGYHGNTTTGIKISHYKYDSQGGQGQDEDILQATLPDTYRGSFSGDNAGIKYAQDLIESLNRIDQEKIAAFIAEPIVGCGGQIPLAKGYLQQVYPFIRSIGGVCISDEVQVGFGRIGSHFWGFEYHGVEPDIVVLGKPIGNGHPMAAVVTTAEIAESFNNGMEFFSSFGGNPVSCAIGTAVLDVIAKENLQDNALKIGKYLTNQLKNISKDLPCIGDVRGSGFFLGIDIVKDRESKVPDGSKAKFIINFLRKNNILTSLDGPAHNVIKIKPPLCFTKANANLLIEMIKKASIKTYI